MAWRPIAFARFDPRAAGQREYLPSAPGARRCRFCLRPESQLKFKKDAHAVPECLGNHCLLSREECDDCNELGSRFEDDLAKHLTFYRAASRIQGKEGNVKHRFGRRPSSITSDFAANRLVIEREIGDDSLITRRTPTGLRYLVKVPGYRPMNALRALARLAVMLAPEEELADLEHIRRWLRSEVPWVAQAFDEALGVDLSLSTVERLPSSESSRPWGRHSAALVENQTSVTKRV